MSMFRQRDSAVDRVAYTLRTQALTRPQIARRFGLSRQHVEHILKALDARHGLERVTTEDGRPAYRIARVTPALCHA